MSHLTLVVDNTPKAKRSATESARRGLEIIAQIRAMEKPKGAA